VRLSQILSLMLLFTSVISNGQDTNDAGVYLDQIGTQYNEISKDMMSYSSAASHGKGAKKVDKKRQELITTVKEAERAVRRMRPYQGDSQLRDSVAAYFKLTHLVLLEDYGKIVDMEEIAEQSYDAMEAYLLAKEKAADKQDASRGRVREQQKAFANKYNINIIENQSKLGQKLETTAKVFAYYNQVYLIFFKSYKDEAYLMDAFSKGDVNAMEQNKGALDASAKEGIVKVAKAGVYNNDATLKNSCQQLLTFYQQEASKTSGQVEFYLIKENYDKIIKAFDAKRQNDRNKADVDQYNKAVNDYNSAVNKYNATNNELNKKRTDTFNAWNRACDTFLDKHIPKYR